MPMCSAALAAGVGQVAEEVALRSDIDRVPGAAPGRVGLLAWPEREALMVLRGERDVLRAGALEDVGPVVGIVQLGAEHRARSPSTGNWRRRRACGISHVGSACRSVGLWSSEFQYHSAYLPTGREGRHGIDAPVNEDAELGVGVPLRRRPPVERIPGRLIASGRKR